MPPRRPVDSSLALAALKPEHRQCVREWLEMLDFEPEMLDLVPPLRQLVGVLACVKLVAELRATRPGLSREVAFLVAERQFGQGNVSRTWYRWQATAAGQFVRLDDGSE